MVEPNCFLRVGMDVPAAAGDCVCGEYVRFDLVHQRTTHFLVCPEVDRILAEVGFPDDIDEAAVKVGMEAANAINQNRGPVEAEQEPEAVGRPVAEGVEVGL